MKRVLIVPSRSVTSIQISSITTLKWSLSFRFWLVRRWNRPVLRLSKITKTQFWRCTTRGTNKTEKLC